MCAHVWEQKRQSVEVWADFPNYCTKGHGCDGEGQTVARLETDIHCCKHGIKPQQAPAKANMLTQR